MSRIQHFGFEKSEDSLGFLLWQATMVWQRRIKKVLESFDVTHPQFVIMATLLWFKMHEYDTTQVAISTFSKLDEMTVSKSLKGLAIRGFVSRTEHEVDTRAKSIALTDEGKNLVAQLIPLVEKVDTDFFCVLPLDDQQELIQFFRQLVKN